MIMINLKQKLLIIDECHRFCDANQVHEAHRSFHESGLSICESPYSGNRKLYIQTQIFNSAKQ